MEKNNVCNVYNVYGDRIHSLLPDMNPKIVCERIGINEQGNKEGVDGNKVDDNQLNKVGQSSEVDREVDGAIDWGGINLGVVNDGSDLININVKYGTADSYKDKLVITEVVSESIIDNRE